VRKEALHLNWWAKEVSPSTELRKWFGHDPERWPEFVRRYRAELRHPDAARALAELVQHAASHTVTLVYAAHDAEHNNAIVLKDVIERVLHASHGPALRRVGGADLDVGDALAVDRPVGGVGRIGLRAGARDVAEQRAGGAVEQHEVESIAQTPARAAWKPLLQMRKAIPVGTAKSHIDAPTGL
jgi:uncharacterized protein YeaO (DUF488 family)